MRLRLVQALPERLIYLFFNQGGMCVSVCVCVGGGVQQTEIVFWQNNQSGVQKLENCKKAFL